MLLLLLLPLLHEQVQSYILSTPLLLVLHLFTFLYFVVTVIVDVVVGELPYPSCRT